MTERMTTYQSKSVRQNSNFTSQINADSTVQPFAKKYFALPVGQIIFKTSRHPALVRGALRGRHDSLARDAMDAAMSNDERHCGGRRSRVVLMPRRWHQVGGESCKRRWQESPVTGEITKETVKTIARGVPECFGVPVVTTLVRFFTLRARLRVQRAPGIPCALFFRGFC
jgi:hypothetical protein